MEVLLLHTTAHFQSQQEAIQETLKIWLQLLHNSLTQARSIFHRSQQSPTSSLHCFMCNPARLSKEIKEWKLLFNYLFEGLLRDFSKFVSDEQFFIAPVISPMDPVIQLMKDVIEEEDSHHILQTDLKPMNSLLLDVTTLLHDQQELAREILKIWLQLLHNCFTETITILHRHDPSQRQLCLYFLMRNPGRLSEHVKDWKVNFDYLFHGFQRDFTVFVQENGNKDPNRGLIPAVDEVWMLFSSIAFKNSPVSEDIEEYARKITDECSHLAITGVATAMIGKNSVDEWKSCLSSIQNAGPFTQIRWCYDALPNSNV